MSSEWRKWIWKTLAEQFNKPQLSDCVILVTGSNDGGKEEIYVHKVVMSLHSSVIGNKLNSRQSSRQELDLSHTEKNLTAFLEFLQCLYDNGESLSNDNVERLLGYSRKYQVRWLQSRCLSYIAREFSNEDALFMVKSEGF